MKAECPLRDVFRLEIEGAPSSSPFQPGFGSALTVAPAAPPGAAASPGALLGRGGLPVPRRAAARAQARGETSFS